MTRQGIALILSAPSGSGKSTLSKMLQAEFPHLRYSISCTTRPMRPGEADGRDYYFLSYDEFEKRRDAGAFAEWAQVHGNYYGTPLKIVQESLEKGQDLLFDIDVQGAAQIKANLPGVALAFILPPNMAELEKRLRLRGQDSEESIKNRLKNARREISEALWYDALILNDDLQQAYANLRAFYLASALAPARNAHLINSLLEESI